MHITIDEKLQQQLDSYLVRHPQPQQYSSQFLSDSTPGTSGSERELFLFDPNTLDAEGFQRLGLNDKTIHTLINYRNKGGHFKQPADIRKIYGLSKTDADRLIPYVRIAAGDVDAPSAREKIKPIPSFEQKRYQAVNINTATAEDWMALPGIGDVLGNRIVKFRTKLGGFTSVDDVRKTYGLSDSVFEQIKQYLVLKDTAQKN
jgi:competence ComEA-like helix-hairpin-helix protein